MIRDKNYDSLMQILRDWRNQKFTDYDSIGNAYAMGIAEGKKQEGERLAILGAKEETKENLIEKQIEKIINDQAEKHDYRYSEESEIIELRNEIMKSINIWSKK